MYCFCVILNKRDAISLSTSSCILFLMKTQSSIEFSVCYCSWRHNLSGLAECQPVGLFFFHLPGTPAESESIHRHCTETWWGRKLPTLSTSKSSLFQIDTLCQLPKLQYKKIQGKGEEWRQKSGRDNVGKSRKVQNVYSAGLNFSRQLKLNLRQRENLPSHFPQAQFWRAIRSRNQWLCLDSLHFQQATKLFQFVRAFSTRGQQWNKSLVYKVQTLSEGQPLCQRISLTSLSVSSCPFHSFYCHPF